MLLAAALLLSTSGTPALTAGTSGGATLSAKQIALHEQTSLRLYLIVEEVFTELSRKLKASTPVSEADAVAFVEAALARDGLVHAGRPLVAVNAHAVDPLFEPTAAMSTELRAGDVVIVDVWAKRPGGAYANLVWTAFVGRRAEIPRSVSDAWLATRNARDKAVALVQKDPAATGDAVDAAARKPIKKAKLERWLTRAVARPLGADDPYAQGAVAKPGETRRVLAPMTCLAIEPGVYRTGEFATRTAVDVCLGPDGKAKITSGPQQREIRALLD